MPKNPASQNAANQHASKKAKKNNSFMNWEPANVPASLQAVFAMGQAPKKSHKGKPKKPKHGGATKKRRMSRKRMTRRRR